MDNPETMTKLVTHETGRQPK